MPTNLFGMQHADVGVLREKLDEAHGVGSTAIEVRELPSVGVAGDEDRILSLSSGSRPWGFTDPALASVSLKRPGGDVDVGWLLRKRRCRAWHYGVRGAKVCGFVVRVV